MVVFYVAKIPPKEYPKSAIGYFMDGNQTIEGRWSILYGVTLGSYDY